MRNIDVIGCGWRPRPLSDAPMDLEEMLSTVLDSGWRPRLPLRRSRPTSHLVLLARYTRDVSHGGVEVETESASRSARFQPVPEWRWCNNGLASIAFNHLIELMKWLRPESGTQA